MCRYQSSLAGLMALLAVVAMMAAPSRAQLYDGVPHLINYQGRLTDTDGNPVANGEYPVVFSIWGDSLSTAPQDRAWISPNCTLLVVNGLFNWQLGSKEGLPLSVMTNDTSLWLGIQVGSDPEIQPRTRLCAAPFAYKAWNADFAALADTAIYVLQCAGGWVHSPSGPYVQLTSDSVSIGTSTPLAKLDVAGDIRMNGFKMPTGAAAGRVLTSDGDGNGMWQASSSSLPEARTGVYSATTNTTTGIVTVLFESGGQPLFSSAPVVFVTVIDPSDGASLHGQILSTSTSDFVVKVYDKIGGSLITGVLVDITYIAIEATPL